MDTRTRVLLESPIMTTLMKMAIPNTLMTIAQVMAGLIETWFIGKLGTDALAAMALVFPVFMMMQMMSAGAMGGGISSSIARSLGAGRNSEAHALVFHALVIALCFGLLYTVAVYWGGSFLYRVMGGQDESLRLAQEYSVALFSGAELVWIFNSLASVLRGSGNMWLPAWVICLGTVILIPLSGILIFGWGNLPAMGMVGGAWAMLIYYALGCLALGVFLLSRYSLLQPRWVDAVFKKSLFFNILKIGLAAIVSALCTNLAIASATALAGHFGAAALAGYGTAVRLEYLMVPLVFGLGGPLVAMVGTCIGAGRHERALQIAWTGAAMSVFVTELIGLTAMVFPQSWLLLFDHDPQMLETGALYLHIVGPVYGFFGLGLVLYFASQGAGRLLWPVLGNLFRLTIAAVGGWLAWVVFDSLAAVFVMQGLALVFYGGSVAWSIHAGAWSGPIIRRRKA